MGAVIEFLNLLDRGFRGKMASWKCGHQGALQPPSAKVRAIGDSLEVKRCLLVVLHMIEAVMRELYECASSVDW